MRNVWVRFVSLSSLFALLLYAGPVRGSALPVSMMQANYGFYLPQQQNPRQQIYQPRRYSDNRYWPTQELFYIEQLGNRLRDEEAKAAQDKAKLAAAQKSLETTQPAVKATTTTAEPPKAQETLPNTTAQEVVNEPERQPYSSDGIMESKDDEEAIREELAAGGKISDVMLKLLLELDFRRLDKILHGGPRRETSSSGGSNNGKKTARRPSIPGFSQENDDY